MHPLFLDLMRSGLRLWQAEAAKLNDHEIGRINQQRGNLMQLLQFGLQTPSMVQQTAELIVAFFPLAVRGGYLREWCGVQAQAAASTPNTERLHAELLWQQGFAAAMVRDYTQASVVLSTAVMLAEQNSWMVELGASLCCQALVAFGQGDTLLARQLAEQAHKLLQEVDADGPLLPQASALHNLGVIVLSEGDAVGAIDWFDAAYEMFEALDDWTYQGRALANKARALRIAGRLDEALTTIIQAEQHYEQTASEIDKAQVRIIRGVILFEMGAWEAADVAYQSAETDALVRQNKHLLRAEIYLNRGEIRLQRDEFRASIRFLEDGLQQSRAANYVVYQLLALEMLSDAAFGLGEQADACRYLSDAMMLVRTSQPVDAQRLAVLQERQATLCGPSA